MVIPLPGDLSLNKQNKRIEKKNIITYNFNSDIVTGNVWVVAWENIGAGVEAKIGVRVEIKIWVWSIGLVMFSLLGRGEVLNLVFKLNLFAKAYCMAFAFVILK